MRSSGRDAFDVWVSTFHSFCARLLRRESQRTSVCRAISPYTMTTIRPSAVKRALVQLDLSTEDYPPRSLRAQISHAKNHGITPDEMESQAAQMRDPGRKDAAKLFRAYNEILRKAAALDFDDLLLRAVELLREHPDVRAAWSDAIPISDGR